MFHCDTIKSTKFKCVQFLAMSIQKYWYNVHVYRRNPVFQLRKYLPKVTLYSYFEIALYAIFECFNKHCHHQNCCLLLEIFTDDIMFQRPFLGSGLGSELTD